MPDPRIAQGQGQAQPQGQQQGQPQMNQEQQMMKQLQMEIQQMPRPQLEQLAIQMAMEIRNVKGGAQQAQPPQGGGMAGGR